jgi:chemotaxis protein CheY-P-specific phosphatase CheC
MQEIAKRAANSVSDALSDLVERRRQIVDN